jgi:signal peptidase II
MPRPEPSIRRQRMRKAGVLIGLGGGVVALDQVTKLLVRDSLGIGERMPLIGEVVTLTHILNRGGILGLRGPGGGDTLILTIAGIAVGILALAYLFMPVDRRLRLMAVAITLGGASSNLFDWVRDPPGVVDLVQIELGSRSPLLNVADLAVLVGVITLSFAILFDELKLRGTSTRTL